MSTVKIPQFKNIILSEDENLIFINKPSGISSLDERSGDAPSILSMAKRYDPEAQLCHRIDKETSGILVIARNPETYREMAINFEKRQVDKVYHAVVGGQLDVQKKSILLPLGTTKTGLAKIDMKEGKLAETIVSTLKMFQHYTLLECRPVSGRLHQIRIHLSSQNFPLVCDTSYGGKIPFLSKLKRDFKTSKWENEQGMMQRVALHAYRLQFELNEKKYDITAPYPKDFDVFVKLLEKHDA
jgi:23S rRNA pseudouridine955/2504/2580 synthase